MRMLALRETLINQGFPQPEPAKGRSSVADLTSWDDGAARTYYYSVTATHMSAKAFDVVRRYSQHLRVHQDIEAISFAESRPNQLDSVEQSLIRLMERGGHKLRNITFSALPPPTSDFDLVMSAEDQAKWLSDLNIVDADGVRID